MSGSVPMLFMVPKEAMELVNAGEAFISSGGVRLLDGTIKALAVPVKESAVNIAVKNLSKQAAKTLLSKAGEIAVDPIMGGINVVSSLVGNVQCAFIQKGVKQANKKLDNLTDMVGDMSETLSQMDGKLDTMLSNSQAMMKTLNSVQMLSGACLAVGVLNCAVTVGGFYMTNKKLNNISTRIDMILDQLNSTTMAELKQQFNSLQQRAIHLLEFFEITYSYSIYSDSDRYRKLDDARTYLNDSYAFLIRLRDETVKNEANSGFLMEMLSLLAFYHARILKYYQLHSSFLTGGFVSPLKEHESLLIDISEDKLFLSHIRSGIFSASPEISPFEKQRVYQLTRQNIPNALETGDNWLMLEDKLGCGSYEEFCQTLTDNIKNNYSNSNRYLMDGMGNIFIEPY